MEKSKIAVSIIGIVYNHEKYVRDMIESILGQKTAFSYEILLHDDCSTDNTPAILRQYADEYPDKIRLIMEEVNQYSRGVDSFRQSMVKQASGKYIAMCEGDDFWLDSEKLAIQYQALEEHPECDMCACWGCTVTEDGKNEISQIRPKNHNTVLSTEEVIIGGGQYLVTAGLFFRKSLYDSEMPFERVIPLDYVVQIRGSLRGGILYIDRKMAAYRRNTHESWSMRVLKDRKRLRMQWEKEKEMLSVLDTDTNRLYHDVIGKRMKSYTSFIDQLQERREEVLNTLSTLKGSRFLWGMGRRGEEFEEFCSNEGIYFDGICDLSNEYVGEKTLHGNRIWHTSEVLVIADNILATNAFAYRDLMSADYHGNLIDLQHFMPYG